MKFILGTKQEMSQVFDEKGKVVPVTFIKAGPAYVTQVKNKEKDGYRAAQIGFGERKLKNIKKPQKNHLKKSQISRPPLAPARNALRREAGGSPKAMSGAANLKSQNLGIRHMKEFRIQENEIDKYNLGDEITVEIFNEGDKVEVSGISKGKGFQGVVKRHGFHGGPRTHGQKHSEREPGSIGSTGPQKVAKGKRMAGRMGGDRTTVKNLKIIKIDAENNILAVSGAVPGRRGTLLEIKIK